MLPKGAMFKAVLLQAGITLVAATIAAVFLGWRGMLSTGLGGLVVLIPSALFALRLQVQSRRGGNFPMAFLVGEFLKVAATVGLMVLVWRLYADVHWLTFFVGLILALKANLFALLMKT